MSFSTHTILNYLSRILVLLICLPIHEYAHGKTAHAFGDKTAENAGRLTLNPIKHLDPLGAISLLVIGVGWAKPIPIDPSHFRNQRRDFAIVSLAGPFSNIVMAVIAMCISKIFRIISVLNPTLNIFFYVSVFSYYFIYLNCVLAVFNLIPIPPLDGSRLINCILPAKASNWIYRHETYFFGGLIVLLLLGVLNKPIDFFTQWLLQLINYLTLFLDMIYQTMVGGVHV